jgi:predicted NBD/HSP70 family sugar kinase
MDRSRMIVLLKILSKVSFERRISFRMAPEEYSHFDQVRMQNRRTVRNIMRHFPQISKAELAEVSGLSFPTVSALLSDLLQTGEAILLPDSATRGGRPAEQFALQPDYQMAVCAYIENHELFLRVYDVLGHVRFESRQSFEAGHVPAELSTFLQQQKTSFPQLSVVCLGIPGVVENGVLTYIPEYPDLDGLPLQMDLERNLSLPVFLENDVNVFVSAERERWPSLVHIFNGANGTGAGILVNRQLIRGAGGYAGELEYLPFFHKGKPVTFCEKLRLIQNDSTQTSAKEELLTCLSQAIVSLICVINPPDVALSGFHLSDEDMIILRTYLERLIPAARCPSLHVVEPVDDLYQGGLLEMAMDYWKSR